jgi:hypothetical protein
MNTCIFTTHATLTKDHAINSLQSLLLNQTENLFWDYFIIYNSHPEEISNEWLLEKIKELDTNHYIAKIIVYDYDNDQLYKTLTQDLINQFNFLTSLNYNNIDGKILFLKSDYCVSKNFNKVFNRLENKKTILSLPIYNAKSKVLQEEINELCKLETFEYVRDKIYYRGGTNEPITPGTLDYPNKEEASKEQKNDIINQPYSEYTDGHHFDTNPIIRFVSNNVQNDYNVHVFTNDLLEVSNIIVNRAFHSDVKWGGVNDLFNEMREFANYSKEIDAFAVHMYHSILSPNCDYNRLDKRKTVFGEEY